MVKHRSEPIQWNGLDKKAQEWIGKLHVLQCTPRHVAQPNAETREREAKEYMRLFWRGTFKTP